MRILEAKATTKVLSGKTAAKILGGVLLALFLIILAFLLTAFLFNRSRSKKEQTFLKDHGYLNLVSVGDHSLNVAKFGNENGAHTIVGLSGLGVDDYSVMARKMTACLEEDNLVVFVDRAGYGLSEDTDHDMTLDFIVEDYRAALANAGLSAPYILMPHSIAGAYANYWSGKYPEEIEAILFVDGTQMSDDFYNYDPTAKISTDEKIGIYLTKLGISRFGMSDFSKATNETQQLSTALHNQSLDSLAIASENAFYIKNLQDAWSSLVTTDIPKLYICASWGFDTPDYNDARQNILYPYAEKMGNCEVVLLPGDHLIYIQQPEACGQLMKEFLEKHFEN